MNSEKSFAGTVVSPGASTTASRTGALLSASDVSVDALFRQAGVIRTDTLDEMLDVADLLVHQPLPTGRRVAIVTNAGGPAMMCADACEAHGLELPPLSEATQAGLRDLLPAEASVANPVDLLVGATADQYAQSLRIVAEDPNIDALISIFLSSLATQPEEVGRAVASSVDGVPAPKPVLAVFMSSQPVPPLNSPGGGRVPGFHTPEPAAIALSHAVRYAAWRTRSVEDPPSLPDIQQDDAGLLLGSALQRGDEWLTPIEVRRLLGMYGVRVMDQLAPDDALPAGVEMVVGVVNDPQFGHDLAVGGAVHALAVPVSLVS